MNIYERLKRLVNRRDFLKAGGLFSVGALGYALGLEPQKSFADTSGINGSRVVWTHDDQATYWDGVTGHYRDFVDQARVNMMIERGVKELTGLLNPIEAWRQIIPDYSPGKKIAIKVNINNQARDTEIDALPQPVNGVIAGLKSIGVDESDIYIMEPSRVFPSAIGDPILALYPNVYIWERGWDMTYGHGVTYASSDPSLTVRHALSPL